MSSVPEDITAEPVQKALVEPAKRPVGGHSLVKLIRKAAPGARKTVTSGRKAAGLRFEQGALDAMLYATPVWLSEHFDFQAIRPQRG